MAAPELTPDLIADLFSAAVDDERWSELPRLLARVTGIEAVSLWTQENGVFTDYAVASVYGSFIATYREHFFKLDPWAGSLARRPLETVMLGSEHMREDELVKTEFYNDWARLGGMYRPIGVKIGLAPGVTTTVGHENPFARKLFDEADKRRVERVLPYLKRALQLRRRMRLSTRSDIGTGALDALGFGVVVCDAGGLVLMANAAAELLSRSGAGIVLGPRSKPLTAVVRAEARALATLIQDAASDGPGGACRLTGRDGATTLLVLVTPLPRRAAASGPGRALVALRSAQDSPAFSEAVLAQIFGLSPTQAQVALAIAAGRTPEEIAADRGIRIATVRTHLAEIFIRTGAETQRDLIRLLSNWPPLRPPIGP